LVLVSQFEYNFDWPIADSRQPIAFALLLTARKQTAYFPALVVLGTGVRSLSAVHA